MRSCLCYVDCVCCVLQIFYQTLGDIKLTIKVFRCFVRSKDSCPVEKEMPFIPEACSSRVCPNSTRVSFSLEQLQELASTTWDLECSVKFCFSEVRGVQVYPMYVKHGQRASPGVTVMIARVNEYAIIH